MSPSRRGRAMLLASWCVLVPAAPAAAASVDGVAPSPLLAIDQNRDTVVERIVAQWGEALAKANAGVTPEQLRTMLLGMRSDQLLAASLAGSLEGVRNVIATALVSEADVKPSLLAAKALGNADSDVVYVPVTPCRLVETRGTFAAVYQGGGPFTTNQVRTYTLQGANGVCLTQLPASASPSAIQLQVYGIPNTGGSGDIEVLPQGGTFGSTATLVYLGTNAFTSSAATSLVNTANKQISVQVRGAGAHVAIDVVGFFRPPEGGFVSSITVGTGLTGGGSGAASLSIDTSVVQSRVNGNCAAGSSIRVIAANGTVTCQSDTNSGGTVTSVTATAGGGLATSPGGGITTTGSLGIAAGGVQNAMIAAGTITGDRLAANQRLPACADGQVVQRSGGAWVCNSLPPIITVVDPSPTTGLYTSMKIGVDGFPVISHYESGSGNLQITKCFNPTCTQGSDWHSPDGPANVGQWSSLALGTDGFPVVSYYDATSQDLKVTKCFDPACSGSAAVITVDSVGSVGLTTSIAIGTDGSPVIAYYDSTNADLKVAKCANSVCTASTRTAVDSAGNVGAWPSIAIGTDGFPVISYQNSSLSVLRVAKCINAACTGSSTITTVDSQPGAGARSSIAIGTDGIPVIAYPVGDVLKVAKCANAACTGSATITAVDPGPYAGDTSIVIGTDGFPVISYWAGTRGLYVAKCVNAACTGSAIRNSIDALILGGSYNSIALGADGFPIVSYLGGTGGLRVTKCTNAACTGL